MKLHYQLLAVLCCIALLMPTCVQPTESKDATLYGGIEIGSSGTKYHVIKIEVGKPYDNYVTIAQSKIAELAMIDAEGRIKETAMSLVVEQIQRKVIPVFDSLGIPNEHQFIICSSHLLKSSNAAAVKNNLSATFPNITISFIDSRTEAIAALMSANPPFSYEDILVIDIGGGNTKLAMYDPTYKVFVTDVIPYGTRTLLSKIVTDVGGNVSFAQIRERGKAAIAPLTSEIILNNQLWTQKGYVIFMGGLAYTLNSTIGNKVGSNSLANLTIQKKASTEKDDLAKFESILLNKETIIGTNYTHEQLYGGYLIMEDIVSHLKAVNYFFADRQDWIPGFLVYKTQFKGNE